MRLSAVIQLVDGFSKLPASGARVRFLLDGKPYAPHPKAQAFYAFADLDDGAHQLDIISTDHRFFDRQITLQVPLSGPLADGIVACVLAPSPVYDYPAGSTVIRGRIAQAGMPQQALAGVAVAASYHSARARALSESTVSFGYGRFDGRYALALRGKLAAPTTVDLDFSKSGYAQVHRQVTLTPGALLCVDIEM